ncbi:MAG: site-specific DNA-methyltransferase [Fimbriimonadaceae bacterium]
MVESVKTARRARAPSYASISETTFLLGDANEILNSIAPESIKLVLTSPPYNIGKIYERGPTQTLDEYLIWLRPIASKLVEKLSPGGNLCWQVGNYVKDGEVFPLDIFFYRIFADLGLKLRNRVIWHFNFGLHAQQRLSGRYETLLWFSKGDDYLFNLDAVRVPQLYPGKRHSADKGDLAGKPSGNPLGKNPSDVWEFSGEEAFKRDAIWELPNVKAKHPEKTAHPCQFPSELAERCILAFSNPGDSVLDPFSGAGTTAVAADGHRRIGIGIDKSEEYVALSKKRLASLRRGDLPLRRASRPVRKPLDGESVARVPSEWLDLD